MQSKANTLSGSTTLQNNSAQLTYNTVPNLPPPEQDMPLPIGMTEWNVFFERIKAKANLPVDDDSLQFALASQIMHCSPTSASVPDSYFVNALRKAAANQVASQVFQDIKNKQKAAQEAAVAAEVSSTLTSIAEATTTAPATVANVKKEA